MIMMFIVQGLYDVNTVTITRIMIAATMTGMTGLVGIGINITQSIATIGIIKTILIAEERREEIIIGVAELQDINLEKSVEHGFCGKSGRKRQRIARK
jgi:hypothetical protein